MPSSEIMCKAQERPQRRHRAMYLAPSAGQIQPQQRNRQLDILLGELGEAGVPLMLEVPTNSPQVVSPPSSGESSSIEMREMFFPLMTPPPSKTRRILNAILAAYHWLVDLILLIVVCFMGCFFYDVEVKVVKGNRHRARARGRSGRVVFRSYEPGITTSLLRTPPRSGTFPRSSTASQRSRDISDDIV